MPSTTEEPNDTMPTGTTEQLALPCACQRCDPEDSYMSQGVPFTDMSQIDHLTPRVLQYPIIDVKEVASE